MDDEALIAALVTLSRLLLQGDLALARATLAETERQGSPRHVRNLCILLLAFIDEPSAWPALRRWALCADDDAARLAIEAVTQSPGLKAPHSDDELRQFWDTTLLDFEQALHPAGWKRLCRDYDIDMRSISLAPPWEGEEGAPIDDACHEILVAVCQTGTSIAAREKAIEWLAVDPSCADVLRALAREPTTPARVKSAVYANFKPREEDYEFIRIEIKASSDSEVLARLCAPLLLSAGAREGEALTILEGLAPMADSASDLARPLMLALRWNQSSAANMAIERICRSAGTEALRMEGVAALYDPTLDSGRTYQFSSTIGRALAEQRLIEERRGALERLSSAPSAPLAAEASLSMLTWATYDQTVAKLSVDGAFLARAEALALMPAVPERVRRELSWRLADWAKRAR